MMHFQHSDWFTQSQLSARIPQFDLIWKTITLSVAELKIFRQETKFLLGQNGGKKNCGFRELSTDEIQKMLENAIPAATKKATNSGLKLFNGTSPRSFLTNLKKL